MTKQFTYDSDSQWGLIPERTVPLEVTVSISCTDSDGADSEYEIEYIENKHSGMEVKFEDLPAAERRDIEKWADGLAADYACEAYQQWAEHRADAMYDAWKDGEL